MGRNIFECDFEMAALSTMTEAGKIEYVKQELAKDYRATAWGNENEPEAREAYRLKTGYDVRETGFMVNPHCVFHGGSFDGEVLENGERVGIIEIKCPYNPVIHAQNANLKRTGLSASHAYYPQIQSNIEVAGIQWCDFVSFDPRQ